MKNTLITNRIVALAAVAVLLGGCASVGGETISLLPSSKILDPLEVPPGLTPVEEPDEFVVPDAPGRNFANVETLSRDQFRNTQTWLAFQEYQRYRDENAGVGLSDAEYQQAKLRGEGVFKVQEFANAEGKTRWRIVDSADSVWARLPGTLRDLGVQVTAVDDKERVVKVKGIPSQESPTFLQRIGVKEYSGKIDQLEVIQTTADTVEIIPRSEFLDEVNYSASSNFAKQLRYYMLARYAVDPEGSLAPVESLVKKRLYQDGQGKTVIEVKEPFEQAWVRIGRTLEAAGLGIVDLDRSAGTYLVSLTPVKETKRSKWAFWRKKKKVRKIGEAETYIVNVNEVGQVITTVTVSASQEQNAETADELVRVLHERLTL